MQRPTAVSQPEKHSHEGLAIPANPAVLLLALPIIQSSDETMLAHNRPFRATGKPLQCLILKDGPQMFSLSQWKYTTCFY